MQFCHLHCHTQYSLLDGAAPIEQMVAKAKADNQRGLAITDHGNMFGVFHFFSKVSSAGLKPILGCEVYLVEDRSRQSFTKGERDRRYHQLLLAKNAEGYRNLAKICSIGFTEGFYHNFPRIDMEILRRYKDGLIATTCCIGAKVPQTILEKGEEAGEQVFLEFLDLFGDDYYIELQRHDIEDIDGTGYSQEDLNQILLRWAKKYNVKVIATNDSHYVNEEDAEAHDILLCLQTGAELQTPNRFKFANNQFYFKTTAEMQRLFADVPFALENTIEIFDKIETPQLKRDVLMPNYALPLGFTSQDDYLRHLCYEGARQRFGGDLRSDVIERLDFELKVISNMKFPGYFLIVQDFIKAAKKMGVAVGPGRGSAAGSLVAYCTEITNIDPIRYNLLFERFLNPERVSMPDIDIDFDDEGRQQVIDYVVDKYGKNQVAQIITYGTMAARSAIRDVGRVLKVPLSDTDKLAKLVPEGPKVTLKQAFAEVNELNSFRQNETEAFGKTLKMAETLEGSVRHRGIHAAGIIIAPDDLINCLPVCTSKDTDLWVTQFDGKYVEDAGMLKMDFLGLKTLTIIKDAIENIHNRFANSQIEAITPNIINPQTQYVDPDLIAEQQEDAKTFELFQRGDTVGVFQFESPGMQKYLKQLKPSNIEDLIAMNALYRPGPMDYIPTYIDRKHGREKVEYPHEWLVDILKPTHGIMVYQEQIMQTAQIVGGYSLGQADLLRRAMGKKKPEEMQKQREIFRKGAAEKNIAMAKADEIFDIMEKFAGYGFNRSHSAAYSILAFQTAYLKAHYPAEYMAAVLSHNMDNIKSITFFLNECGRMGIVAKLPDVNESKAKFTVNKKGEIRFAMAGIKGVGEAAVQAILDERKNNNTFANIFDLTKRVNLRAVNKKALENLAYSGAFDCFPATHRAQFFYEEGGSNLLEKAIKYGNYCQQSKNSAQVSLFGDSTDAQIPEPPMPNCAEWPLIERLKYEREMIGIYLSGHPLDDYKVEMSHFATCSLGQLAQLKQKAVKVGGVVMSAQHRQGKNGNLFGIFTLEDFDDILEIALFGEDYVQFKGHFEIGNCLFIEGEYKPRWNNSDQLELRINKVRLLSSILADELTRLSLILPIAAITPQFVTHMQTINKEYSGNIPLLLKIYHPEHPKQQLSLTSKKIHIRPSREALKILQNLDEAIQLKLN